MKISTLFFLLVPATAAFVAADGPPPGGDGGPQEELVWLQPSPIPPVASRGPVRARLAGDVRAHAEPPGELAGLRAVSLREGSAVVALAGATRPVRPGERIGAALVKAIGADRIILERSDGPGGTGTATLVVTFGPGGEARVRTYAPMSARTPPPEIR
jgi:hypothetical protein